MKTSTEGAWAACDWPDCNWPDRLKEGSAKNTWPEKTRDEGAWVACDWLDMLKEGEVYVTDQLRHGLRLYVMNICIEV